MRKNAIFKKASLAIAALLAAGALYPLNALAAQKLLVKDSGGTVNKFVITDDATGLSAPDGGFVGVGTATPLSAIHVAGTSQTYAQLKISGNLAGAGANAGGGVLLTFNNGTSFPLAGDRLGYMNVGAIDDTVATTNRFGGGFVFSAAGNWSVDRISTPNIVHFPTSLALRTAGASGVAQTRVTIDQNGYVGIGTTTPTTQLQVVNLPVYTNNAAAVAGGLTAGAFYRTGADPDPVCVVH